MTAVASSASLTDLVRFLIARVDDDDDSLKREARKRVHGTGVDGVGMRAFDRLRAETAAKRDVIASAQQLLVLRDQPSEKPVRDGASTILRSMARAYSAHPSFRAEWA